MINGVISNINIRYQYHVIIYEGDGVAGRTTASVPTSDANHRRFESRPWVAPPSGQATV